MKIPILCGSLVTALGFTVLAYSNESTVLDKVYSADQADRGAGLYEAHCAMCHEGDEADAPPPKGSPFIDRWREAPLQFLFTHISTSMPGDAPASLQQAEYLDIVAYILRENDYPAGTSPLAADKLGSILLVGPDGPRPLPADALVRVVGCLAGAADDWTLSVASAPVRVTVSDRTTPEELAQSSAMPPGTAVYRLRNAADLNAPALRGQRVQAKGVFAAQGNTMTVSVQSIERAGTACDQ